MLKCIFLFKSLNQNIHLSSAVSSSDKQLSVYSVESPAASSLISLPESQLCPLSFIWPRVRHSMGQTVIKNHFLSLFKIPRLKEKKKDQNFIVNVFPSKLGFLNIYECLSLFSFFLSNFHIFFKAQFSFYLCQEAFLDQSVMIVLF